MNKKALAPVIIGCSLIFILATFLFFTQYDEKTTPGASDTLGEEQLRIIETYVEAEEIINFLQMSAEFSSEHALKNPGDFDNLFLERFDEYIETCNSLYGTDIDVKTFSLSFPSGDLIVESSEPLVFDKDTFTHEVYLKFKVGEVQTIPSEEITKDEPEQVITMEDIDTSDFFEAVTEDKKLFEEFKILIVPVNYDPNDPEFLSRAEGYINFVNSQIGLIEESYIFVDETYTPSNPECPSNTLIGLFAEKWYQKRFGESLDGNEISNKIPIYNFRVVGIDGGTPDENSCGCGYTSMFSPHIYIGDSSCKNEDTVIHEMGHTFGLCDTYDTYLWERQNLVLETFYDTTCGNIKPDETNSDCSYECNCKECIDEDLSICVYSDACASCQNDITTSNWCFKACCYGTYADTATDGYYNIMGPATRKFPKRFHSISKEHILNFLEKHIGGFKDE